MVLHKSDKDLPSYSGGGGQTRR